MKLSIAAVAATTGIAVASIIAHAPQAQAGTSAANGTAFCQSALPVFDTQIRKRPLGVNNEGDSNAFVSCSIPVGYNPGSIINGVIYMTNRTDEAVAVSCTLVDGVVADAGIPNLPAYYPQDIALLPGQFTALIWDPADYELESFSIYQNYSCSLPPGVEINLLGHDYEDSPPAP